jgi:superfamily II DNA or RNA helicase
VVFHESIATAEGTYRALKRLGVRVGIDHSGLSKTVRRRELDRYRNDRYRVFVAVRALDEGVDIPSADVAVISAGTRSRRQRIQRIGRILRADRGKQALVVSILVRGTPEESLVGGRDTSLLGVRRVRHHRWPERSLAEILPDASGHCPPDTYKLRPDAIAEGVDGALGATVRDLTIRELGLVGHGVITSRS